jgi:hypothetical protein
MQRPRHRHAVVVVYPRDVAAGEQEPRVVQIDHVGVGAVEREHVLLADVHVDVEIEVVP